MNSNLNMIQGDLRHMDRSTTITNRDAFNIESTVTEQQLAPTTSLVVGNDGKVVFWSWSIYSTDFNNIQPKPSWYLQIPPPRFMKTMQTVTELRVREIFWCTFKIGTYL